MEDWLWLGNALLILAYGFDRIAMRLELGVFTQLGVLSDHSQVWEGPARANGVRRRRFDAL